MATITPAQPNLAISLPGLELYRLTVEEYERLADARILKDPRVELIGGYLVRKMTKKPRHSTITEWLRDRLAGMIPRGWHVRKEDPVRLPDFDEPEPDLVVARGEIKDYAQRHPGPGDVALLIEVSESSLPWDRGPKLEAYARAGISQYLIVNLEDETVEAYSVPSHQGGIGYGQKTVFQSGQDVPILINGQQIGSLSVADLFS